jgi:hypothetical protein
MAMRSWVLKSWPSVHWQLPDEVSCWPTFQHMGTDVRADVDDIGRRVGETVWAARLDSSRVVGAAWEWVELLPGVPAIRDPNGIVTNGYLLGFDGTVLEETNAIVGLNRLAHSIPWQAIVARVARGEDLGKVEDPLIDKWSGGGYFCDATELWPMPASRFGRAGAASGVLMHQARTALAA